MEHVLFLCRLLLVGPRMPFSVSLVRIVLYRTVVYRMNTREEIPTMHQTMNRSSKTLLLCRLLNQDIRKKSRRRPRKTPLTTYYHVGST